MMYVDIEEAIQKIVDTPSKVARERDFDISVFAALVDRQNEIIDLLKRLPVTDIVHCQDCRARRAVQMDNGYVWRCPMSPFDLRDEGYCYMGVRKDED